MIVVKVVLMFTGAFIALISCLGLADVAARSNRQVYFVMGGLIGLILAFSMLASISRSMANIE